MSQDSPVATTEPTAALSYMVMVLGDLKRDEGLRLKPYTDSVGKLTIGYGHNLDDNGITEAEADRMLANDAACADLDVSKALPWVQQLDHVRRGVMVELAFNMGIDGLLEFRNTLAAIQRSDWETASNGLLTSLAAHQEPARVARWAAKLRTGTV